LHFTIKITRILSIGSQPFLFLIHEIQKRVVSNRPSTIEKNWRFSLP